ncbi:MAG: TetR/AcrR family transcriptional regulator [Clostridia bacterium]|nr:TetR/AcrR family transcriptional regulator [Clostridia bacterium]
MNIKNNQRYKMSSEKIETAFLALILKHRYEDITVSQICEKANINRSTFYCHYDDINDLIIKIESKFAKGTASIFNFGERQTHEAFIELFTFVKENKYFYKAFLNIPYITNAETSTKMSVLENIEQKSNFKSLSNIGIFYRASFFGAGIKEMCRLWLQRDCKEPPEQMAKLLLEEYGNRKSLFK